MVGALVALACMVLAGTAEPAGTPEHWIRRAAIPPRAALTQIIMGID